MLFEMRLRNGRGIDRTVIFDTKTTRLYYENGITYIPIRDCYLMAPMPSHKILVTHVPSKIVRGLIETQSNK